MLFLRVSQIWQSQVLLAAELSLIKTIQTRLKSSIFGIFWIVILERRQPSFVFRTKICPKIPTFQVTEFFAERFFG